MAGAPAVKLEKAYLLLLEPSADGSGKPGASKGQIDFMFNPKEYSVQKSSTWKRNPSRTASETANAEFTGAEPRSLSLELFLDATEKQGGDVGLEVEKLFKCTTPDPATLGTGKTPSPPFVQFSWGSHVGFVAFVKSVTAKYSLFREDGTPIRATCTLSLEEIPTQVARQNPTSGSLTATRTHTVVSGDSLASIAYAEYGSPGHWRVLAEANDIDDPLRLPSGSELLVPELEPEELRT